MAITPPGAGTFTTLTFVLIAIGVVLAVLCIVAGMRRSRARREAERQVVEEAAEAGVPLAPAAPPPTALRDAALDAHALDRSSSNVAPPPPANDDLADPRPVGPEPIAPRADPPRALDPEPAAAEPVARHVTLSDAPAGPSAAEPSPADGPATQLKGLGPKVATRLAELGITTVGQIAALDADQAQALDGRLGPFAGRLHRDRWVEQARFLAAGDVRGFEAVFGRL